MRGTPWGERIICLVFIERFKVLLKTHLMKDSFRVHFGTIRDICYFFFLKKIFFFTVSQNLYILTYKTPLCSRSYLGHSRDVR